MSILGRSRSSDVATISTNGSHGLTTGDYVDVILMTDLTYNTVNIPVTVIDSTTFTFSCPGTDEAYAGDTAGKVYKINNVGIINQYSLWDLKFKPDCLDPRGMVLVNDTFWCDIWLTGRNYINVGTSRKGERIADGAAFPLISTKMGSNGVNTYDNFNWYSCNEIVAHWGKKLLSYTDFCIAAYNGETENGSYGSDNQYTCRCPGDRFLSKWGLEQAYGVMFIWGSDGRHRLDASTTSTQDTFPPYSYYENIGDGGNIYMHRSVGLTVGLWGGYWNTGAYAGSRLSYWNLYPWNSNHSYVGARARSGHIVVP